MKSIRIAKAGMSTTVQDLGRERMRHFGVVVSGAMDRVSHELANRLVGNEPNQATLEMTCVGDTILFPESTLVAVCGADMSAKLLSASGDSVPLPRNRPVLLEPASSVRFGTATAGFRAYLAVSGGIDVPMVTASRSTYLRAGVGGHLGRRLQADDLLPIGTPSEIGARIQARLASYHPVHTSFRAPSWHAWLNPIPDTDNLVVRFVPGSHWYWLSEQDQQQFANIQFTVSSDSDRMGYRLSGKKLTCAVHRELTSDAVSVGTIQLPPDGDPILLMVDGAPTGGYPRLGHVASVDLPIVAQARPGQTIQFRAITIEEAQQLLKSQRRRIEQIVNTIRCWSEGVLR